MFWVFDEVKRGIYKRAAVMQESENHSKNGVDIELPLSDTLEIKGIKANVLRFPILKCLLYQQNKTF